MQRLVILTALVGMALAQKKLPPVNRNQIEYADTTPCPIEYVDDTSVTPRPGFRICTKGNIANCAQGSTWYLDLRGRCQKCVCDTPSGGLFTAHCNVLDCKDLPKSTPVPGRGVLSGRGVRQNCGRRDPDECKPGCTYLARYRYCMYCDCAGTIDLSNPE